MHTNNYFNKVAPPPCRYIGHLRISADMPIRTEDDDYFVNDMSGHGTDNLQLMEMSLQFNDIFVTA